MFYEVHCAYCSKFEQIYNRFTDLATKLGLKEIQNIVYSICSKIVGHRVRGEHIFVMW